MPVGKKKSALTIIFLHKIPEGASFALRQSVCRQEFNSISTFI